MGSLAHTPKRKTKTGRTEIRDLSLTTSNINNKKKNGPQWWHIQVSTFDYYHYPIYNFFRRSILKWRVKGAILVKSWMWSTSGHRWVPEVSLIRPTTNHCCRFIAAHGIHSCHTLPEDEHYSFLDATSWAHRAESDSKNRPLINTVKWSPLMPTMRQFPFSQIN